MSERLTDIHVAHLATGRWFVNPVGEMATRGDLWAGPVEDAANAYLRALALEVQQARQRRCGNCQHFVAESLTAMPTCGNPDKDLGPYFSVTPEWFCADFTPKEAR